MEATTLSAHEVRKVAVSAVCDPRTVKAYVEGRYVVAAIGGAIEAALRKLGRADLVPAAPAARGVRRAPAAP